MKLIFCGTPQFAVPTLDALIRAGHEIALVVSQPDRPVGRKATLTAPPVKLLALAHMLPIAQPEKIKSNAEFRAQLEAIAPDAIIVVAYGRIVPDWMLALPKYGNINCHASLLPKYRGAAPIQWAIANGEPHTGVTTMRIDSGLDTGDMLLQHKCVIAPEETAVDLFETLAECGADLMVETLAQLERGTITPIPQNHAEATLAPILTREDALINFFKPATHIHDRWRGFQPWPGAYTYFRGKKLIVNRCSVAHTSNHHTPGTIIIDTNKISVQCGDGTLLTLDELQLEGRNRMPAADLFHGFQLEENERLGIAPHTQAHP